MKRILTALCALALFAAGAAPAFAAEPSLPSGYYPISVEEYTYGPLDEPRINKAYRLSLSDDPGLIPTEDFERGGRHFYLLDMTRKDEVGVDVRTHTETVTLASDTDKMDNILQRLDAEMEAATEDGYTGTLRLDHTSVQVTVDGYKTSTKSLSATRTYPNLSNADVSLIPKTITDNGNTLTLADVQWASAGGLDGEGGIVIHYNATATYTGIGTGGDTQTVVIKNSKAGTLVIDKRDSLTGKPLEGVTFKVTTSTGEFVPNENGQISSNGLYFTDKDGKIVIKGVVGTLVVTETATIPGYTIDEATRTQTVVVYPNDTQNPLFHQHPQHHFGDREVYRGHHDPAEGRYFPCH